MGTTPLLWPGFALARVLQHCCWSAQDRNPSVRSNGFRTLKQLLPVFRCAWAVLTNLPEDKVKDMRRTEWSPARLPDRGIEGMTRSSAAQALGVHVSASRSDARFAYMRLLQDAAAELGSGSPELAERQNYLKEAYEAFCKESSDGIQNFVAPHVPTSSSNEPRFLGIPVWIWIVMLGIAALAAIVALGSGGTNDLRSTTSQSSTSESSMNPTESAGRPSASPTRRPDSGRSGYLKTCWRDGTSILDELGRESTRVTQVSCSGPFAQWRVYREVRVASECASLAAPITTNDGWVLCIRPV